MPTGAEASSSGTEAARTEPESLDASVIDLVAYRAQLDAAEDKLNAQEAANNLRAVGIEPPKVGAFSDTAEEKANAETIRAVVTQDSAFLDAISKAERSREALNKPLPPLPPPSDIKVPDAMWRASHSEAINLAQAVHEPDPSTPEATHAAVSQSGRPQYPEPVIPGNHWEPWKNGARRLVSDGITGSATASPVSARATPAPSPRIAAPAAAPEKPKAPEVAPVAPPAAPESSPIPAAPPSTTEKEKAASPLAVRRPVISAPQANALIPPSPTISLLPLATVPPSAPMPPPPISPAAAPERPPVVPPPAPPSPGALIGPERLVVPPPPPDTSTPNTWSPNRVAVPPAPSTPGIDADAPPASGTVPPAPAPPAPGTVPPAPANGEPLVAVVVNDSRTLQDRSHDVGNAEHTGHRNIAQRVWDGFTRAYQTQKSFAHAESDMVANQTMFGNDAEGRAKQEAYNQASVSRFREGKARVAGVLTEISRYSEDEKRRELADTPHEVEAKNMIKGLLSDYVSGRLDDANFGEARGRMLAELTAKYPELAGNKNLMFSDNLLDVAKQIMLREDTLEARQRLIDETKIVLAQSQALQRTEAKYSIADKFVDKLEHLPGIGKVILANEAAAAVAVSVAVSIATGGTSKAASLARLGLVGVGSAAYAGAREHKQYGDKRRQHLRERAVGEQVPQHAEGEKLKGGDKQRERLEKTVYHMRTATELGDGLLKALKPKTPEGDDAPFTPESFMALATQVAEVKARLQLSDENKIDLIAFSSVDQVMLERDKLIIAMALGEVTLQKLVEASPELKTAVLLEEGSTVADLLRQQGNLVASQLTDDIEGKDKEFRSQRRAAVAKRMAIAGVAGIGVGATFQEVRAALTHNAVGVFSSGTGAPGEHQTALRHLRSLIEGKHDVSNANKLKVDGANTSIVAPKGIQLVGNGNGTVGLRYGDKSLDGLRVTSQGTFDAPSTARLHQAGLWSNSHSDLIKVPHGNVDQVVSPEQYAAEHGQRVHRLWENNDTARFDQNELRADLVVGPDNHAYYDISRMTAEGSFHGGVHDQVGDMISNNHGELLVSVSKGTQATPTVFHFNGTRADLGDINNNSFVHMVNGRPRLSAAYAEVADPTSAAGNGVVQNVHVLATDVGPGLSSVHVAGSNFDTLVPHYTLAVGSTPTWSAPEFMPIPTYTQLGRTERPTAPTPNPDRAPSAGTEPGVASTPDNPSNSAEPGTSAAPETVASGGLRTLMDLKEDARAALAELNERGKVSQPELIEIGGKIGKVTQHIDDGAVTPTDLFSLYNIFYAQQAAETEAINQQAQAEFRALTGPQLGGPEGEAVEARRTAALESLNQRMQTIQASILDASSRIETKSPIGQQWEGAPEWRAAATTKERERVAREAATASAAPTGAAGTGTATTAPTASAAASPDGAPQTAATPATPPTGTTATATPATPRVRRTLGGAPAGTAAASPDTATPSGRRRIATPSVAPAPAVPSGAPSPGTPSSPSRSSRSSRAPRGQAERLEREQRARAAAQPILDEYQARFEAAGGNRAQLDALYTKFKADNDLYHDRAGKDGKIQRRVNPGLQDMVRPLANEIFNAKTAAGRPTSGRASGSGRRRTAASQAAPSPRAASVAKPQPNAPKITPDAGNTRGNRDALRSLFGSMTDPEQIRAESNRLSSSSDPDFNSLVSVMAKIRSDSLASQSAATPNTAAPSSRPITAASQTVQPPAAQANANSAPATPEATASVSGEPVQSALDTLREQVANPPSGAKRARLLRRLFSGLDTREKVLAEQSRWVDGTDDPLLKDLVEANVDRRLEEFGHSTAAA